MFRVFDVPSMASSVCVDSTFSKNGDGKVSKSEFGGPSKHFNHLDKNNDGYITEDEAPRGRPKK